VKDFSYWCEYEGASEGSGRSEKIWLINPDNNQTGLFKFKKDIQTTDHISECIAYKLTCLLNIPCARFDLGKYKDKVGSMSYNIVNKEGLLFLEGIHFINHMYPHYDPEQLLDIETGNKYSIEMIKKSLEDYQGVFEQFIGILIFDFLIGNTDRHQSNWALICENDKWRLSPLYDNSSSLCAYLSGSKLEAYFGRDMRLWNSLVDTKSKSLIRIKESDTKMPTHLDVMKYLVDEYYDAAYPYVMKIRQNIASDKISNLLNEYTETELPAAKKQIIGKFLISKIEMLTKVFNREEE
jgi:Uncharacterized protein related to capsule biosynthesis enzymes